MAAAEFVLAVRVYYEDTDAGGVVYHASHVRFLERARTEWLRSRGLDQATLRQRESLVFVVRELQLEYLRPARLDDLLHVDLRTLERGRSRLLTEQAIWRGDPVGGEAELIARGRVALVCVDTHTLRPRAVPPAVCAALWPSEA